MSYARFGWDGSEVYVFLSVGGHLECCGCAFSWIEKFDTTEKLIAHLDQHRAAGHRVPQETIDALLQDAEANDRWIAGEQAQAPRRGFHEDGTVAVCPECGAVGCPSNCTPVRNG